MIGDRFVKFGFVFAKVFLVLLFEPGRAADHSHAGITPGQGLSELFIPTIEDSVKIKNATFEIPLIVGKHFYTSLRQVAIQVRHSVSQRTLSVFLRQESGDHPQAELIVFQPGLE